MFFIKKTKHQGSAKESEQVNFQNQIFSSRLTRIQNPEMLRIRAKKLGTMYCQLHSLAVRPRPSQHGPDQASPYQASPGQARPRQAIPQRCHARPSLEVSKTDAAVV